MRVKEIEKRLNQGSSALKKNYRYAGIADIPVIPVISANFIKIEQTNVQQNLVLSTIQQNFNTY